MGFDYHYAAVRVRDMDRAIAFYTKGLGMELRERVTLPHTGGEVAMVRSPGSGQVIELNWYPPRGTYKDYRQGDELDHLSFHLDALGVGVEHLVDHGAQVNIRPFKQGEEWFAYLSDPDGIWIELVAERP